MAERFEATVSLVGAVEPKQSEMEKVRVELDQTSETVFMYVNGKTIVSWDRKTGKTF